MEITQGDNITQVRTHTRLTPLLLGLAGISAIAFATSTAAQAQAMTDGQSAASAASDAGDAGDIVVTAQKRNERLQDVPISVVVVTESARIAQNTNSLASLATIEPSIHVSSAGRSDELYVRGIGSGVNASFDQSVATFVDGVYHGRSRNSAAAFLDLDHIEILKGPQTTFFGNSAIAGAFNIETKRPSQEFSGSFRALYAPAGQQYALEGAIGGAITERLSARAAVTANGQGGYVPNVNTGQKAPNTDNIGGRVAVAYELSDAVRVDVKAEGSHNVNHSGLYLQYADCPPKAPFVAAGFCAAALAIGNNLDTSMANSPGGIIKLDTFDSAITVAGDLGNATVTSVTGLYGYNYQLKLDADALPGNSLQTYVPERYRQISQELRVASPTNGAFSYIAGVYFQADRLNNGLDIGYNFLTPVITGIPAFSAIFPYLPLSQSGRFSQTEHIYSAFASVTWKPVEHLSISPGVRGSIVYKRYDLNLAYGTATADYGGFVRLPTALQTYGALLGLGNPGAVHGARTDRAVMPSLKVQYEFSPVIMAYASYARGFKAGGFNGADTTLNPANIPFAPEHVNAYEIGLKSQFLDRRVTLNLAAFRSDYHGLQVATNQANTAGAYQSLVQNSGASRSQGFEADFQVKLTDQFTLSGHGTYLDSKYIRYQNVAPTQLQVLNGQATQDLSGKPTQYSPKWSGSLTGTYGVDLMSDYNLSVHATGIFSSWYYSAETGNDDPLHIQNGYARLDAGVTLQFPGKRLALDIIGKNLTSTRIRLFTSNAAISPGSTLVEYEQGRNVAAQIRYAF